MSSLRSTGEFLNAEVQIGKLKLENGEEKGPPLSRRIVRDAKDARETKAQGWGTRARAREKKDAGLPDKNRRDPHKTGESPALRRQRMGPPK